MIGLHPRPKLQSRAGNSWRFVQGGGEGHRGSQHGSWFGDEQRGLRRGGGCRQLTEGLRSGGCSGRSDTTRPFCLALLMMGVEVAKARKNTGTAPRHRRFPSPMVQHICLWKPSSLGRRCVEATQFRSTPPPRGTHHQLTPPPVGMQRLGAPAPVVGLRSGISQGALKKTNKQCCDARNCFFPGTGLSMPIFCDSVVARLEGKNHQNDFKAF